MDSAVHRINHYPLDNLIGFASVYPLDSDLSGGQRYPWFEQLGPGQTDLQVVATSKLGSTCDSVWPGLACTCVDLR